MPQYKEAERTTWSENIEALFAEVNARSKDEAKRRRRGARHRLFVGLGFLFLALICVLSLYWGLPRLLRGAASSTLNQLGEIRASVDASLESTREIHTRLREAQKGAQEAVDQLEAKAKAIPTSNNDLVRLFQKISDSLSALEKTRKSQSDPQWSTLVALLDKENDIRALHQAVTAGDATSATGSTATTPIRQYTNHRGLETSLAKAAIALDRLKVTTEQLKTLNETINTLNSQFPSTSEAPSAISVFTSTGSAALDAVNNARSTINNTLLPALSSLSTEMGQLQRAGSKITETADRLNDASRIGTGPVAYTVLAIAAMLATFGVSAVWRWSRADDDAIAAHDRYFAGRLIALNAVMLASRDGPATDGIRADTSMILATLERAILGVRHPKEGAFPGPLPTLTTAGEIINIVRGDKPSTVTKT